MFKEVELWPILVCGGSETRGSMNTFQGIQLIHSVQRLTCFLSNPKYELMLKNITHKSWGFGELYTTVLVYDAD